MRVYFDIETIPDPLDELMTERLLLPDDDLTQEERDLVRQSFHPLRGRIVCVSVAIDEHPVVCIKTWDYLQEETVQGWDSAEEQCLIAMATELRAKEVKMGSLVIGHNICAFDIPWIYLRCIKYDLPFRRFWPWPVIGGKPWEGGVEKRVRDTSLHLRGPGNRGPWLKLTETTRYLGIDLATDEGSGADCLRWWLQGERHLIAQHCNADVDNQRELYKRLVGAK